MRTGASMGIQVVYTTFRPCIISYRHFILPAFWIFAPRNSVADPVSFLPDPVLEKWSPDPDPGGIKLPDPP